MSERATHADYANAMKKLHILIVGGGAVGQVYGYHLQQAGVDVSYFLKARYAAEAAEGFQLHRYGLRGLRPRRGFEGYEVFTDHRVLRGKRIDQIWICVSSTALRSGFLERLADACPNAVWVAFQPGLEDRQYLVERVPSTRLVTGMVNYIAYQAPLPGEDLWPQGIAYFVPPWSMTVFHGPEPFASAVANLLQKGGLPAGVRPDAMSTARFGSSVLIPFVVALECVGWSFEALRGSEALLDLVIESIIDVQAALEKETGDKPGSFSIGRKKWAWKLALLAAPTLASFPIETYFKFHFSKMRDQTDHMILSFAQLCRDNAILPRALEALAEQWRLRRPPLDVDASYRDPKTGKHVVHDVTPLPGELKAVTAPAPVSTSGAFAAAELVPDAAEPSPAVAPAPSAPAVQAIEVDFDFAGDAPSADAEVEESKPELLAAPIVDDDDEISEEAVAAVAALSGEIELGPPMSLEEREAEPTPITIAAVSRGPEVPPESAEPTPAPAPGPQLMSESESEPVLDVEMEALPVLPPPTSSPLFRTMEDLEREETVLSGQMAAEPVPAHMQEEGGFPFALAPAEESTAPSEPAPEPDPQADPEAEAQPTPVPSIIVDTVQLESEPPPEAAPEAVMFGDELSDDARKALSRQDVVKTEQATDAQTAALRDLKKKLRTRLGGNLSPALKKKSSPDES